MTNRGLSVHILGDSLEGGLGQVLLAEGAYLSGIGWRVTLIAPSLPESMQTPVGATFVEVSVPAAIRDLTGMVSAVLSFRRKFKGSCSPKFIHAHGLRSFVIARSAFPFAPVVVTFLGAPPRGRIRQTFFRFSAKISSGAISVAPISVPGWEHWWHWSPAITTNAVKSQASGMSIQDRAIEPASASKADTFMTVGWLGRFESPKRPDRWLAALARARESGIDIRGVMSGDGPLLARTHGEALRLNLDVDFLGWQAARSTVLSRIDVLLAWSDSEGVPLVLQEAIWSGIPCITNDLPGPTAFLGVGSLGVVDEDSVVGVLKSLTDPKTRSELQLEQFTRLQTLLAEGRAEWKFASRYQHLATGGHNPARS